MRLFEFTEDNSLQVKLTGIISQLVGRLNDTDMTKPYSLTSLLSRLRNSGISLSPDQFRQMIEQEPLSNLIADVQGDSVVFKDHAATMDNQAEAPEDTTGTLKKMADRAEKKREE